MEERDVLANKIKDLHRKLRIKLKKSGNLDDVWEEHVRDEEVLKDYATAMHQLATKYWSILSNENPKTSRINWTRHLIVDYFLKGGIRKERTKDSNLLQTELQLPSSLKLQLLDVGSCYNPFHEFEEFEVTAIDLCPAVSTVYPCDFLSVNINETSIKYPPGSYIHSLKSSSFHVVVFSFLLEYLPSSCQRWTACKKAARLLASEGLLIIVTPDSKAAHANSKVMKSWRTALSSLGLRRIAYEKLLHAHCMAFRKVSEFCEPVESESDLANMMYIPQDFHEEVVNSVGVCNHPSLTEEEIICGFSHLPLLDAFE